MTRADIAFWQTLSRRDPDLSESTKVLLAEMAYHFAANCQPSPQRYLARLLHWSAPTVKRAVRQAINQGWITVDRPELGKSNRYQPVFPERYVA